jgi:hypothetical protein
MERILEGICTSLVDRDLARNIMSLRSSQDLFDDLADDDAESQVAHRLRDTVRPSGYRHPAVIARPFDLAAYANAIQYPFKVWSQSRFSNGSFGVWYGADTLETSVHETVYHWVKWLNELSYSEEFAKPGDPVTGERRVYSVRCDALLLDFRHKVSGFPQLVDPRSYVFTQPLGLRLQQEGHPGLLVRSARCDGDIAAVFRESVLSNPRDRCFLTYQGSYGSGTVVVRRNRRDVFMRIQVEI